MKHNKKQIRNLNKFCESIRNKEVEIGWYKYKNYTILIGEKGGTSNNERVKRYMKRNKDLVNAKKKQTYDERKAKGRCPKCNRKANYGNAKKKYIMCKQCRNREQQYNKV